MNGMSFVRAGAVAALTLVSAIIVPAQSPADTLVYADFQSAENGRLVSKRGGQTLINWYAQNPANAPQFVGLANATPPAPQPAQIKEGEYAASFDYKTLPNDWAGVNIEVFGQAPKDGKLLADDVSGYSYITMQIFAKGPTKIRVEMITRDNGVSMESGYPQSVILLKPGFNTYKLKLNDFRQPQWATKVNIKKDVLAKLTSVSIGVFCERCQLESGTVVVDNITFEK